MDISMFGINELCDVSLCISECMVDWIHVLAYYSLIITSSRLFGEVT